MVYNIVRNGANIKICVEPSIKGKTVTNSVIDEEGVWVEYIKDSIHFVYMYKGIHIDETKKNIVLDMSKYDFSPSYEYKLGDNDFKLKYQDESVYNDQVKPSEILTISMENDVFLRVINSIMQDRGLAFAFHPVTLDFIDLESDALLVHTELGVAVDSIRSPQIS
tara:strand:- start:147 stop:641 length:495 start_codon:yes stop_codon:yes gene_type:complete